MGRDISFRKLKEHKMYTTIAKVSGSVRRQMRRTFDHTGFTRAQALRVVAGSEDLDVLKRFEKHVNLHVRKAVARRMVTVEAMLALREKRSEAAKKAAATRAAKKQSA